MTRSLESELESLESLIKLLVKYRHRAMARKLTKIVERFQAVGTSSDLKVVTAERVVTVPGDLVELYESLEPLLYTSKTVLRMSVDIDPLGRGLVSTIYTHASQSKVHLREVLGTFQSAIICERLHHSARMLDSCDLFEDNWWVSGISDVQDFTEAMITFLRRRTPAIERRLKESTIKDIVARLSNEADLELADRYAGGIYRGREAVASFELDVPIYVVEAMLARGCFSRTELLTPTRLSESLAWVRLQEGMIRHIILSR